MWQSVRDDLRKGIMILPSSHSQHNGGGFMRTMLRLESYDAAMLSSGLKYSLLVGVRGKYDRFYRQTSGEIRC